MFCFYVFYFFLFFFFFFNDTATTEIYTLSYTTLFRSEQRCVRVELRREHEGEVVHRAENAPAGRRCSTRSASSFPGAVQRPCRARARCSRRGSASARPPVQRSTCRTDRWACPRAPASRTRSHTRRRRSR